MPQAKASTIAPPLPVRSQPQTTMPAKESKKFIRSIRDFREAYSIWDGLVPRLTTVPSPDGPTYYVSAIRDDPNTYHKPASEDEWNNVGWAFQDIVDDEGRQVRSMCARPTPKRDSPLAAAAARLAKACRGFKCGMNDVVESLRHSLLCSLEDLPQMLDVDPDPATCEQDRAAHEVIRLINENTAFKTQMAAEGIAEVELLRLKDKESRMKHRCRDIAEAYELWKETIDLLMRPNLHDRARVDERFHLLRLTGRLAAMASARDMPRAALQALEARLQMLEPRKWFRDREMRHAVIDDICRANDEVAELHRAFVKGRSSATECPTTPEQEDHPPAQEPVVNMLIREGKTWRIRFEGTESLLPNLIGFTYLQKLLANQGKEISVADLRGRGPVMLTSDQATFDGPARAAVGETLRHDVEVARLTLEQAEENDDRDGMAFAQERLANLAGQLHQAVGRPTERPLPNELQRTRSAVAKAIAKALDEIGQVHPLAQTHLKQSIVSPAGLSPAYRPVKPTTWQVNLAGSAGAGSARGTDHSHP